MKTRAWMAVAAMVAAVSAGHAAVLTVDWDAVTANADGSQPITDLSGYRLFYARHSLMGLTTSG